MPGSDVPRIHPTAIVSSEARLADDVTVSPYALIEGPVTLGPGCHVGPYVHMMGRIIAGQGNLFHTGCVIGDKPQHLGYKNEDTRIEIGNGNTFREFVTIHRGMPVEAGKPGTGVTIIGNDNFVMSNSHVAHDCRVGNNCIFATGAVIGGHAEINDRAFLSGNTAVHQFCRMGRLSMLGGTSAITQDLPPFWTVQGGLNVLQGVNLVGLKRAGMTADEIHAVRRSYQMINRMGILIPDALAKIEAEFGKYPAIQELVQFVRTSKRGICVGRTTTDRDSERS